MAETQGRLGKLGNGRIVATKLHLRTLLRRPCLAVCQTPALGMTTNDAMRYQRDEFHSQNPVVAVAVGGYAMDDLGDVLRLQLTMVLFWKEFRNTLAVRSN